jgi:hypothetical protein
VVSIDSLWFPLVPMDIFLKFKESSLFKKRKPVFSIKRHVVVELPVNLETAANLCYSRALQAAIIVMAVPLPL